MSENHTVMDRDGMKVLVVKQMNKRFDKNGKELPQRKFDNLEIVHASEIARYFGIDMQDVGIGDNRVLGAWSLVHGNHMGQRVPYNDESTQPGNINLRTFKEIKNERGQVIDTEEVIVEKAAPVETDDGMYARHADVLRYAAANGWSKGGGWPHKAKPQQTDIGSIVAAVLSALAQRTTSVDVASEGTRDAAPEDQPAERKKHVWTDEERHAAGERLKAAREAKKSHADVS